MRADITSWYQGCLICATRHVGQSLRPLLTPIPEEGPFHRVAVDVLQLPVSAHGNKYAIVFMDYLTKWSEVFPAKDQSAYTIAKTLVERSLLDMQFQLNFCLTTDCFSLCVVGLHMLDCRCMPVHLVLLGPCMYRYAILHIVSHHCSFVFT